MIVEFSRRKFLLAAGGSALALPLLEALTPQKALAAFEETRRVIFYLTANGMPRGARPEGTGPDYRLGPVLAGLSKHRADLLSIAGLDGAAALLSKGDPHGCGLATTLSGRKVLPGEEFKHHECFTSPDCPATGWGDGPSLDHELGQQQLAAKVPVVHGMLNFCVRNCPPTLTTRSSYRAPGVPITPLMDPQAAFDAVFGLPGKVARRERRRAHILDALKGDISALQRSVSTSDRARLDQHLTALRELELQLASMERANCDRPARPTVGASPLVERDAGGREVNWMDDDGSDLPERHTWWRRLMVAAFACDLTRVITFIAEPAGAETLMPWIGEDPDYPGSPEVPHLAASHAEETQTLIAMDHFFATQISALVDDLKRTNGVDGRPLFETSAVAWFNEMANGFDASQVDKPHTIVGSLGGYFRTGQAVAYPEGTPHNVLLTAIAQAMGMNTSHYGGTEPELLGGDVGLVKA